MVSRKRVVIAILVAMAIGYIFLPIHLGLSTLQTDVVFSILLVLALFIIAFEDHRNRKERKRLTASISLFCLFVLFLTMAVLLSGIPFAALIPVVAICGGILYWYIDRYVPPMTE